MFVGDRVSCSSCFMACFLVIMFPVVGEHVSWSSYFMTCLLVIMFPAVHVSLHVSW